MEINHLSNMLTNLYRRILEMQTGDPMLKRSDDLDLKIAETIYIIKSIKDVYGCRCKQIDCFGMQILICKLKFY